MKTLLLCGEREGGDMLVAEVAGATLAFLQKTVADAHTHTYRNGDDLIAEVKKQNSAVLVTSVALPEQTVLALHALDVVLMTVCLDPPSSDLADICIHPLVHDRERGFCGPKYLLPCALATENSEEIAARLHLSKENLYEIVHRSSAEEELPKIVSLFQKLEWDSQFFGFNVGYVTCLRLTPTIQKHVRSFVEKEDIAFLEYQCDCHDRTSILVAEQAGYSFVDMRMTFGKTLHVVVPSEKREGVEFRKAIEGDIPTLRRIAHGTYRDTRYYFDGHFNEVKLALFYENWIEKAVRGTFDDEAYVLTKNGTPIGYCSVQYQGPQNAQIGLIGLDAEQRGQDLGTYLLSRVLHEVSTVGVQYIYVVTQGRNYAAQRLYQKCGFRTEKTELWYHKWFR